MLLSPTRISIPEQLYILLGLDLPASSLFLSPAPLPQTPFFSPTNVIPSKPPFSSLHASPEKVRKWARFILQHTSSKHTQSWMSTTLLRVGCENIFEHFICLSKHASWVFILAFQPFKNIRIENLKTVTHAIVMSLLNHSEILLMLLWGNLPVAFSTVSRHKYTGSYYTDLCILLLCTCQF